MSDPKRSAARWRLSRVIQPRNPLFWLAVLVNLLSSALAWIAQTYQLNTVGTAMVIVLSLGNAWWGMRLLWSLGHTEPARSGQGR